MSTTPRKSPAKKAAAAAPRKTAAQRQQDERQEAVQAALAEAAAQEQYEAHMAELARLGQRVQVLRAQLNASQRHVAAYEAKYGPLAGYADVKQPQDRRRPAKKTPAKKTTSRGR